jgi:hypothetical protein
MRVPEVFRFGYRQHNAINVALRGLAARLGVADR